MRRTFTISILCFLFVGISIAGFAQTSKIETEYRLQGNSLSHEFQPIELCLEFKYNILKNFCLGWNYDRAIALFKVDGVKDHFTSNVLGAKVGYSFLNKPYLSMQVSCGTGTQIRRKGEWDYSYYDVGIFTYIGNARFRPVIGILLRRYDSHNTSFSDYTKCLVSLGLNTKF